MNQNALVGADARSPSHSVRPPHNPANPAGEFFRYHGVWAPGVRLFRAIGFRAKGFIIGLTFAIPIAVLAWQYLGDRAEAIEFSAKERTGLTYAREAMPLLRQLQRQRLLAAQEAAKGSAPIELADVRNALQTQMARLASVEKSYGDELGTTTAFAKLIETGKSLPTASRDVVAVFDAHTNHIQALLDLLGTSTDGSNLTLDPDLDTYYLMDAAMARLPSMTESVAQVSSLGSVMLVAAAAKPAQLRRLAEQVVMTSVNQAAMETGLNKAVSYNASVKAPLQLDAQKAAVVAFSTLVESTVLRAEGMQGDAAAHIAVGDKAVNAMFELTERASGELDRLLVARVSRLQSSRNLTIVVLALSLLGAVYLFVSFRMVLDGGLREVAFHVDSMRNGDLTTRPRALGNDEVASLMRTIVEMQESLRRIVSQVRGASDNIVVSSTQISIGARDLSSRTERSSANLQQSAAAMEQISAAVKQTAGSVQDASSLATENSRVASRGGEIIGTMVTTMQNIHASSSKISDIIATIDSIAFQTNILALNAAVEAARAGETGRGFAVVASEVRALSQRTAAAAREVKGLITTSVEQVASGSEVVKLAGSTIGEIVDTSKRVNRLLSEIATGADEQTRGVAQTTQSVHELDTVTQQNAALVEQTAAAAASLQEQAKALAVEVAQFRLPPTA